MGYKVLITGGCGFIGRHLVKACLTKKKTTYDDTFNYPLLFDTIYNIDMLTNAAKGIGDLNVLTSSFVIYDNNYHEAARYNFIKKDINDIDLIEGIDLVIHTAAETHVDNSLESSSPFIQSNIVGTSKLLEMLRKVPNVKLIYVSTDEVYGALDEGQHPSEESDYVVPANPYSASKAAAENLVMGYCKTYNIPFVITRCSNNFGNRQNKEKFIPKLIHCYDNDLPFPLYGEGLESRDWIHVQDHVDSLLEIAREMLDPEEGSSKNTKYPWSHPFSSPSGSLIDYIYNIDGGFCFNNITMVNKFLKDKANLITKVTNRKGHDYRYELDSHKLRTSFNFKPVNTIKAFYEIDNLPRNEWTLVGKNTPWSYLS